jgi:hypothetical protein
MDRPNNDELDFNFDAFSFDDLPVSSPWQISADESMRMFQESCESIINAVGELKKLVKDKANRQEAISEQYELIKNKITQLECLVSDEIQTNEYTKIVNLAEKSARMFHKFIRKNESNTSLIQDKIDSPNKILEKAIFTQLKLDQELQHQVSKLDQPHEGQFKANLLKLISHAKDSSFDDFIGKVKNDNLLELFNQLKPLLKAKNAEKLSTKLQHFNLIEAAARQINTKLSKITRSLQDNRNKIQLILSEITSLNELIATSQISELTSNEYVLNLVKNNIYSHAAYSRINSELTHNKTLSPQQKTTLTSIKSNLEEIFTPKTTDILQPFIELGHQLIQEKPCKKTFITHTNGIISSSFDQPTELDSTAVYHSLKQITEILNAVNTDNDLSPEQLLALEAFTHETLHSYISTIGHIKNIGPNYLLVLDELKAIRIALQKKINEKNNDIISLRHQSQYKGFYAHLREKFIRREPPGIDYPLNFWLDAASIENMSIEEPILKFIASKTANVEFEPEKFEEGAIANSVAPKLIHENKQVGYQIYSYPKTNENKKPSLILVVTKDSGTSNPALPSVLNNQLGLFGDKKILILTEEILSDIFNIDFLEGYEESLRAGTIDFITTGFGNCGTVATVLGGKIGLRYQKTKVRSLAAGSTPAIPTEEAYNLKRDNFYPIRIRYINDGDVDRIQGANDFSDDLYHTFPLAIPYNEKFGDLTHHNRKEYGQNRDLLGALYNPIILREIYDELSSYMSDPNINLVSSVVEKKPTHTATASLRINSLIELGKEMGTAPQKYTGTFLKLADEADMIAVVDRSSDLNEKEATRNQALEAELKKAQNTTGFFSNWFPAVDPKANAAIETKMKWGEYDPTINALRKTIAELESDTIRTSLHIDHVFYLILAMETLLINYNRLNINEGKLPELIDLIKNIRSIAIQRKKYLTTDSKNKKNNQKRLQTLLKDNSTAINSNKTRADSLSAVSNSTFQGNILSRINLEDQFLEYIGFKLAIKNQPKVDAGSSVHHIMNSEDKKFDISIYTPTDTTKKQRIVISCNGTDDTATIGIGANGAGNTLVMDRVQKIQEDIFKKLSNFTIDDFEITFIGHGAEGAVATTLAYNFAKANSTSTVHSLAFGSPRFLVPRDAEEYKKLNNFIPIRLLNPQDTNHEYKIFSKGDYDLSHETYYTIPIQFRISGMSDLGLHGVHLYADPHNIKHAMRNAYLMNELVNGTRHSNDPIPLAHRLVIDSRPNELKEFSNMTVAQLKEVHPGKLIRIMKYCVELSEKDNLSKEDKTTIKKFFYLYINAIKNTDINSKHGMDNLFCKKMFDHGYNPCQLFAGKWKLQRIISKELNTSMNHVDNINDPMSEKDKNELILKRNFDRVMLAFNLFGGQQSPAGGGVNGALFGKHLEAGTKIKEHWLPDEKSSVPFLGVFKPHPLTMQEYKGRMDLGQIGEKAKGVLGMDARLNPESENRRVENEIFAYEMFHIFGFGREYQGFPTTIGVTNCIHPIKTQRPASFCAFMPGLTIVGDHTDTYEPEKEKKSNHLNDKNAKYTPDELHIWQWSKIFDFLTGNLDGHPGNAFVKIKSNKAKTKYTITGAVNFDYDKSQPIDIHDKKQTENQYQWANLFISKHAFTEKTKDELSKMLLNENSEKLVGEFVKFAQRNGEQCFTDVQIKRLQERICVLKLVANGEIKKLSDLRNYRSKKAMDEAVARAKELNL